MSAKASSTVVFQYYSAQIKNLYREHNLANIQSVDSLLKQFPGKEYLVYRQICKKCRVEPDKQRTAEDITSEALGQQEEEGKVSNWLIKNGYKTYGEKPQFRLMEWGFFMKISTEEQLQAQGVPLEHIRDLLALIRLESGAKDEEKQAAATPEKPPVEKPSTQKPDFKMGDDCFTKVFKPGENDVEEGWLKAKVMRVNKDGTFDIYVHNAMAHGVPPEAVNVPRHFLEKSVENVKLTPPTAVKRPHPDSTKFSPADRVWVCGLRSHQSYNGLGGTIVIFHEKRYQVELDNGELFAIRPENLFPWDVDVPEKSVEAGLNRLKSAGYASEEEKAILKDLITRLMRYDTSRSTDHVKLGHFAAGYLIAQRRFADKDSE